VPQISKGGASCGRDHSTRSTNEATGTHTPSSIDSQERHGVLWYGVPPFFNWKSCVLVDLLKIMDVGRLAGLSAFG
jgi:hypothetical protein